MTVVDGCGYWYFQFALKIWYTDTSLYVFINNQWSRIAISIPFINYQTDIKLLDMSASILRPRLVMKFINNEIKLFLLLAAT